MRRINYREHRQRVALEGANMRAERAAERWRFHSDLARGLRQHRIAVAEVLTHEGPTAIHRAIRGTMKHTWLSCREYHARWVILIEAVSQGRRLVPTLRSVGRTRIDVTIACLYLLAVLKTCRDIGGTKLPPIERPLSPTWALVLEAFGVR